MKRHEALLNELSSMELQVLEYSTKNQFCVRSLIISARASFHTAPLVFEGPLCRIRLVFSIVSGTQPVQVRGASCCCVNKPPNWFQCFLPVLNVCLQQLQEQLDTVDAAANFCPSSLKLGLEEVQQRVVERWEELRDYTEQRGEELKLAYQRYLFNNIVKTPIEFIISII